MKIYKVLKKGDYHEDYCEDYLFAGDIGKDKILCAVMDGCTMATDSYFASTLIGKLLRKIAYEYLYKEGINKNNTDTEYLLKNVLRDLFSELKNMRNQLMLNSKELLSTIILMIIDTKSNAGALIVIGDGLICIDGEITDFDQDNKPDYIGFHINEDFNNWYNQQTQKIKFENIKDISIASDGILSFKKLKQTDSEEQIEPVNYLLKDSTNPNNSDMLNTKLKHLENKYGLLPTDDLAVIRIVF
jgi:hypothetical protein